MSRHVAIRRQSVRRKESRLRLRLPAVAIMHSGTVRVILCDLSQSGAKIFSTGNVPPGRDFVLRWGPHEGFGAVVWQRDGLHGVQFEEPLAAGTIIATREMQDSGGMGRDEVSEWMAELGWAADKVLINY